jgi:hypothetical protein
MSRKTAGPAAEDAKTAGAGPVEAASRPRNVEDSDGMEFSAKQISQIQELIQALLPESHEAPGALIAASPTGPQSDLYILKYRRGMTGVQTGFIRASTMDKAEKVGHSYCDSLVGCRYINVTKAVIADESILDKSDAGRELREKLASA